MEGKDENTGQKVSGVTDQRVRGSSTSDQESLPETVTRAVMEARTGDSYPAGTDAAESDINP